VWSKNYESSTLFDLPHDRGLLAGPPELHRRPVGERAVRPLDIGVLPPVLHDPARVAETQEPVLVEAFVARPAVEALAVGILDRLAGIDEGQGSGMLVRSFLQRPTDELL
jgi:hypothetical protein